MQGTIHMLTRIINQLTDLKWIKLTGVKIFESILSLLNLPVCDNLVDLATEANLMRSYFMQPSKLQFEPLNKKHLNF